MRKNMGNNRCAPSDATQIHHSCAQKDVPRKKKPKKKFKTCVCLPTSLSPSWDSNDTLSCTYAAPKSAHTFPGLLHRRFTTLCLHPPSFLTPSVESSQRPPSSIASGSTQTLCRPSYLIVFDLEALCHKLRRSMHATRHFWPVSVHGKQTNPRQRRGSVRQKKRMRHHVHSTC